MTAANPADAGTVAEGPLGLPVSHYSYVVDDMREGVEFWASKMKAGPFYLLDNIEFEQVLFEGEPATFEHSAAFGQWGPIVVELQQLHGAKPAALLEKLDRPVNHFAYVCPDAPAASERLAAEGFPLYMQASFGPIDVRFHDHPVLGHSIELHQGSEFLDDFFLGLRQAATDWDGRDPLRAGAPPVDK